ncbi:hypothetical protein TREES_T100010173 [Tupaia chinensis]|uniref:Uncharacterized protein n=1 Tax=Tupaia chinensis TaxID=246437 RepID=L9JBT0_TUPCH|nr:hypothetical protein TREES_T100010173 [Tupaia chinensis]
MCQTTAIIEKRPQLPSIPAAGNPCSSLLAEAYAEDRQSPRKRNEVLPCQGCVSSDLSVVSSGDSRNTVNDLS